MKFEELKLRSDLLKGLKEAGFEETFAIQEKATPIALEGKDVIGKAQSGSGKTLAFLIPVIERVHKGKGTQALIIAPTRELAMQIEDVFKIIAKYTGIRSVSVYGGKSIDVQARALRAGVEVIMATPGRLMDHMERRNVDLCNTQIVVLDEADRMLDMGFIEDIDHILKYTPCGRQTMLFSATLPDEIRRIVHRYMHDPVTVELNREAPTVTTVVHEAWIAMDGDKVACLKHVIDKEKPSACIIFVEMKREADMLERILSRYYSVAAIHGDLSQSQRENVLHNFRDKKIPYLIATDVAARGLDIPLVSHVFNFDLPKDVETFIHRVGRTGRAGLHGRAIHIALPGDYNQIAAIEHLAKVKIPHFQFHGTLSSEEAMKLSEMMTSRDTIIPKWGKRTGGRGGSRRGPPRFVRRGSGSYGNRGRSGGGGGFKGAGPRWRRHGSGR
ncbi:MAG: DEAD/DEAH box helicase [Candidatus Aenigmatarchaeota archaeon]